MTFLGLEVTDRLGLDVSFSQPRKMREGRRAERQHSDFHSWIVFSAFVHSAVSKKE